MADSELYKLSISAESFLLMFFSDAMKDESVTP